MRASPVISLPAGAFSMHHMGLLRSRGPLGYRHLGFNDPPFSFIGFIRPNLLVGVGPPSADRMSPAIRVVRRQPAGYPAVAAKEEQHEADDEAEKDIRQAGAHRHRSGRLVPRRDSPKAGHTNGYELCVPDSAWHLGMRAAARDPLRSRRRPHRLVAVRNHRPGRARLDSLLAQVNRSATCPADAPARAWRSPLRHGAPAGRSTALPAPARQS